MWQTSRPPCKWCEFGQVFNGQLGRLYKLGDWKTADSSTEVAEKTAPTYWPQSHRHPRVPSIRVGEIFLCLILINFPTRFCLHIFNSVFRIILTTYSF